MRTYCEPLRVVILIGGEQSAQGVIGRNGKTSKVGQKLATEVEDDEEEVEGDEANDGVGLGDTGLLLEIVDGGVLGQLEGVKRCSLILVD